MSEAYRDRAPDMAGRLDLIERALAQIIETLERIERRPLRPPRRTDRDADTGA
jgi:hypothetical protein